MPHVYVLISPDETLVKIGHSGSGSRRPKSQLGGTGAGWNFLVAILGAGEDERAIHRHFHSDWVKGIGNEVFHLRGGVEQWVRYVIGQPWSANTLSEMDDPTATYSYPHRFPWTMDGVGGQLTFGDYVPFADVVSRDELHSDEMSEIERTKLAAARGRSDDYQTPAPIIDLVRKVMGAIDLDPASDPLAQRTVGASAIFTQSDNGLRHDWSGRVFLSPPGRGQMRLFIDKLREEYLVGRVTEAVVILPVAASSAVYAQWLLSHAHVTTAGRIQFENRRNSTFGNPIAGSTIFHLGGLNDDLFIRHFSVLGTPVGPIATTNVVAMHSHKEPESGDRVVG